MSQFREAQLQEFLIQRREFITIDDFARYKRARVKLHAKGIVLRDEVLGSEIKTKQQQPARSGEFLVAEIDAKVGGFGIVPHDLDGAIVSSHYFLFEVNELICLRPWIDWYVRSGQLEDQVTAQGSTNYAAIRPKDVLQYKLPLPPLAEQQGIIALIESLAQRIEEAQRLKQQAEALTQGMLLAAYNEIIEGSQYKTMAEVAPLVRRTIKIDHEKQYPELGIRSFGKGSFQKPAIRGVELGTKRLFSIEPGDLIFSNVFAWEGAVAVAKPQDAGRFGSHRFITCLPKSQVATAKFLCFYFLTADGLERLGSASPGGAGRNRTLGLEALAQIQVPVPDYSKQLWFDELQQQAEKLRGSRAETQKAFDAFMPSVLAKAFAGELVLSPTVVTVARKLTPALETRSIRPAVGAYVVNQLYELATFGRVQLQKLLYLAETAVGINLGGQYVRAPLGPLDKQLLAEVEIRSAQGGWFTTVAREKEHGYRYVPGAAIGEGIAIAEVHLGDCKIQLDQLIALFRGMDTYQAEMVTTLYAVWNDFLIDGHQPTDSQIVTELKTNWHKSKVRFKPQVLYARILWMRQHNLVPRGIGPRTINAPR